VIDASNGNIVSTVPALNVFQLGFSPLGTYIITWQLPSKDEEGNAKKNLKVWKTVPDESEGAERTVVGEYVQKSQTGWNLQYSPDEKFCARSVTNEVQFFQSDDLRNPWNKLRVEGVTDFALSPGKNHSVAVFVPERKVRQHSADGWYKLTFEIGYARCSQGLPGAPIQRPCLAKDFLQERQSPTEVERSGHQRYRVGPD
jgi:uncharacterized protein with WD repeat